MSASIAGPLAAIGDARRYWDLMFHGALGSGDQDAIDAALAEQRALSRLAMQLIYPPGKGEVSADCSVGIPRA